MFQFFGQDRQSLYIAHFGANAEPRFVARPAAQIVAMVSSKVVQDVRLRPQLREVFTKAEVL